jgi:hypothetical protein
MRSDPEHRRTLSRWLGAVHMALCVLWVLPLHGHPVYGRASALQTLNDLVPFWAPAFGLTGGLLIGCSLARRSMIVPHAVGAVVALMYAALSAMSALWQDPWGSLVPATFGVAVSGVHFLVQRSYVQVVSR